VMSGIVLSAVPKRVLDYSTLVNGGPSQSLILADKVPLLDWRELTLTVRIHVNGMSGSNSVTVAVFAQSETTEDPALPFVSSVAAGSIQYGVSNGANIILTSPITTLGANGIVSLGRVVATGVRSGALGPILTTISVSISGKRS